ncbi:MAG: hypothetical protein OJF49_002797 [Ktedonobacterales bacterium]|nr:MAG: hypothetical protein OJF49_002797 [Ktedonobacterales bacterium]
MMTRECRDKNRRVLWLAIWLSRHTSASGRLQRAIYENALSAV